jgi:hypothetical protein
MFNAERFSEKMPFMPDISREGYGFLAQALPELLGYGAVGQSAARGGRKVLDNLGDMRFGYGDTPYGQRGTVNLPKHDQDKIKNLDDKYDIQALSAEHGRQLDNLNDPISPNGEKYRDIYGDEFDELSNDEIWNTVDSDWEEYIKETEDFLASKKKEIMDQSEWEAINSLIDDKAKEVEKLKLAEGEKLIDEYSSRSSNSLYMTFEKADGDTYTIRISDHKQPKGGGGYVDNDGVFQRNGEADEQILVKPLTRNGEPLGILGDTLKGQRGAVGLLDAAEPKTIVGMTKKQGGYSVNPANRDIPTEGLMVGGIVDELVTDNLTPDVVQDFMRQNKSMLDLDETYLGTWVDENGLTHLDVSWDMPNSTRANTDAARQAGALTDQISLWDLGHNKEVAVPSSRFIEYPPTAAPGTAVNKAGKEYPVKRLTPEGERTRELRQSAQQDIDEGLAPEFFPVSERYYADPSSYGESFDTKQILPKKQETADAWTLKYDTPEARQNLLDAFEIGNADPGSTQWYAMGQLQDAFIGELGLEEGLKMFKQRFADSMAATTGGAPPPDNLLMAHYMNVLKNEGKPLTGNSYELPFPVGAGQYGLKNLQTADKLMDSGLDPVKHPKRYSFSRDFTGDLDRATIDEQMMGGFGVTTGTGVPMKAPNYYGIPERVIEDMASEMGIPAAEAQDAMWAGLKAKKAAQKLAKDKGISLDEAMEQVSPHGKPMIQHVNEMLYRTSKVTGETMDEVLNRFINAKGAMYAIPAGAIGAGLLYQPEQQIY